MAEIETHGPVIIGVTWCLFILCSGFLAIRLYAKLSRGQGLWWDDHVLVFSWVMFLIEVILTQLGYQLGFGKHYYNIPTENLPRIALQTSIAASISCFASTASKISFGVTLLRLTFGWQKRFVWFSIVTLFIIMLPSAIFTWVQCTPIEKAWNTSVEGYCWDVSISVGYGYFNAACCAVIDFALALIPVKLISGLQMKTKEKIGVSIAMSMGLLAGICAIIKGIYLGQLKSGDFYYNGVDVTIWTAAETATAIIGASIPVLRVLFREKLSSRGYNISERNGDVHLSTVGGTRGVRKVRTFRDDEEPIPKTVTAEWTDKALSGEDNDSDRSMLDGDHMYTNSGGIQVDEYVIDFHQADRTPASRHRARS